MLKCFGEIKNAEILMLFLVFFLEFDDSSSSVCFPKQNKITYNPKKEHIKD